MKKFLIIALVAIVGFTAFSLFGGASAKAESSTPADDVVLFATAGTGRVSVDPDIAYLNIGVATENESAKEAMAENNETMAAVLAAIREAGITDRDIQTSHISIDVLYDYSRDTAVMRGYMATNSVAVTVRDLDLVATLLDVSVAAGANEVNSISFDKEDKTDAYNDALAQAVARAKAKGDVLHAASGVEGTLVATKFVEAGAETPYQGYRDQVKAADGDYAQIMPGQIEISASVSVEYRVVK